MTDKTMRADTGLIRLDTPRFTYQPALDGVRGLGVFVVMFYHFGGNAWLHGAVIMVDIFFVLSAFLIMNLLLDEYHREDAIDLRGFYYRRALRLWPAMYALLAIVSVAALADQLAGSDVFHGIWVEIVAVAVYSYNMLLGFFGFGDPDHPRYLLHLWTLSMEEWFYLFWPLTLIWAMRRRSSQKALLVGTVLFIAFWMGIRLAGGAVALDWEKDPGDAHRFSYPVEVLFRFSVMRPDSLMIGCLAAIAARNIYPLSERARRWLAFLGAVSAALIAAVLLLADRVHFFDPFGSVGYNVAVLFLGPGLIWLYYNPTGRTSTELSRKFWVYAGKRSYGIYIWHEIPNAFVPEFGSSPAAVVVRSTILGAMTFGIAELSWRFVEAPFLRRKHKRYTSISGR